MILASEDKIRRMTELGCWGTTTLDEMFQANADRVPARRAVVDPPNRESFTFGEPKSWNYAQLRDYVERLSACFLANGLRKDDIISFQLPNIIETIALYLACARIGLIANPMPSQYRLHEILQIIPVIGSKAFVTSSNINGFDHVAMINEIRSKLPTLETVFAWGTNNTNNIVSLDTLEASPEAETSVTAYLAGITIDANDIFAICLTSGTEAQPKCVPRSHNHWIINGNAMVDAAQIIDGDSILNPFPMVNIGSIGGLMMPWLEIAGTLHQHQPFDLGVFLGQIGEEKINYTVTPPAVLNMLLKEKKLMAMTDLSALKSIGSGSAPLSPWMVEGFQTKFGICVNNIFGSNEGTSLISDSRDTPDPAIRAQYFPRYGAGGYTWHNRVAKGMRTKIIDTDTGVEITEPGKPGELMIAGCMVFSGYFNAPELNAEIFDGEGFFHTGDLLEIAKFDGEPKYYRFVGRLKEIIIRGGMNISSSEVDGLVDSHPKVRESAAIGIPDDILGERLCCVVVPRAGEDICLADITAYLKEKNVAVYKWPEILYIAEAIPRNPMNKIVRRDLRQMVLDGKLGEGEFRV